MGAFFHKSAVGPQEDITINEFAIKEVEMATKKERIREADQIVDQNVAPVTAQPATPEEVAQAPVEVPAEQVTEPIIDEPVVDEPPVEVNPETIDMQVQIPTDQIAAAVAQATGDVVPAETAPDAVEAQQAEEAPMVADETVPEGSVEAPVQQPVMESMEDGSCGEELEEGLGNAIKTVYDDAIDENCYPLGNKIFDFIKASSPTGTDEQMADRIASKFDIVKAKALEAVNLFHKGCVLMESEEDEDVLDSIDIPEDEADLPDSYAPAEADAYIDDLFSEEPDDDELLDKIEDFVNSDDHSTEDVSDALRTAAAFLDQIADDKKFSFVDVVGEPEEDEIEEGPMTDNEEDLHESKKSHSRRMRESKRFNESIAMDANRVFVGDPIEVLSEDLFDEVCGDDIPADGVLKKDGKVIGLVAVSDNGGGDTKSEHTDYYYWLETGIIGVIDMKYAVDGADADECPRIVDVPSGKCKVTVQYDGEEEVYLEVKDAKTGEKLFCDELDLGYDPDHYDDEDEDYYESKKSPRKRMREAKTSIILDTDKVFVGDPIEVLGDNLLDEICGPNVVEGPLKKDGKTIGLVTKSVDGSTDTVGEHTECSYWLESGMFGVVDMHYSVDLTADYDDDERIVSVPSGKCKVAIQNHGDNYVSIDVIDANTNETLFWDDIDFDFNPDRYEDDDEDEDYYESRKNKQSKLRESNKPVSRKPVRLTSRPVVTERHSLKESSGIIYPAGSMPMGRSDEEDLVARQERVHEARRKAIREYRQKVVSQREPSRPVNNGRFNEALRDSVRSIKESADPKSWAANTFMDKYEESSKLNYKELLKNGFLG